VEKAKGAKYEPSSYVKIRSEEFIPANFMIVKSDGTEFDEQTDYGVKDGWSESVNKRQ